MTERKQNRVRIDAITNAIRRGEYDDKLGDLRGAIDARMSHKKQEVLALVQEVYGEGYTVSSSRQAVAFARGSGQNVTLESTGNGSGSEVPIADALGADPDVDGAEFESRSPIIG